MISRVRMRDLARPGRARPNWRPHGLTHQPVGTSSGTGRSGSTASSGSRRADGASTAKATNGKNQGM